MSSLPPTKTITLPHPRLGSWEVGLRHVPAGTPAGRATDPTGRALLIGGTGQGIDTWNQLQQACAAAGIESAVFAGRGVAPSAAPELPWTLDDMVADTLAVLDHLGWSEPVTVVGHSMGGFVAELLARRHPERVAHGVLVGGHNEPSVVARAANETILALADAPEARAWFSRFEGLVTTLDVESLTQNNRLAQTWWEVLALAEHAWSAPHAATGQAQAAREWICRTLDKPALPGTGPRPAFTLVCFDEDLHMPSELPASLAARSLGGEPWVRIETLPGGHGALFSHPRPTAAAIVAAISDPPGPRR